MSSSMAVAFLFLLGLAITSKADPNYLDHICSNTTTFTPNSTYQYNLNLLLSSLSSNSTNPNGFHNTTTGQTPDTVYGLFLCRGDLSTDVCQDCVSFATQDVVQRCPVEKVAVIWYDECLLRYSNQSFFNSVSEASIVVLANTQNATNQTSFSDLVRMTMNGIASEASGDDTKFATGETNFSSSTILYTLGQCTQDLTSTNCQRCLQISIGNLRTSSVGSRTLGPSCYVRFETYLFYNQSAVPAPPPSLPPPAGSRGNGGLSTVTIVAIVVPIVVSVLLFVIGFCILRRRPKRKHSTAQEDDGKEQFYLVVGT